MGGGDAPSKLATTVRVRAGRTRCPRSVATTPPEASSSSSVSGSSPTTAITEPPGCMLA